MRVARVIVDPGRDKEASNAGLLFITPFATMLRRETDVVDVLTEAFSPPEIIDAELQTLAQKKWPELIQGPEGYNIAGAFEFTTEDCDAELSALDVTDIQIISPSTAAMAVRSRVLAFPWPKLADYSPRAAARLRGLWHAAIVALEYQMDVEGVDRLDRTDDRVEYGFSDIRGAGAASFEMVLESSDPLFPYIRLESTWFHREDGEEPGPTIRYPIEWLGNDEIRLVADNGSPVGSLEELGTALAEWWLEKLPGGRPQPRD